MRKAFNHELAADAFEHKIHSSALSGTCLESPERVAGVWASVEETAGFSAGAQEILSWQTLSLGNVPNL